MPIAKRTFTPAVVVLACAVVVGVAGCAVTVTPPSEPSTNGTQEASPQAEAPASADGGEEALSTPAPVDDPVQGIALPSEGLGRCQSMAVIDIVGRGETHADMVWTVTPIGTPVDMGANEGANGTVKSDAQGVYSYTVAPNDGLIAIGQRLCIEYNSVLNYNHASSIIQPGMELIVRPDPAVPWEYEGPEVVE